MAEIVNLNLIRKERRRAAAAHAAELNRVRHGLPKRVLTVAEEQAARRARELDGKKLD